MVLDSTARFASAPTKELPEPMLTLSDRDVPGKERLSYLHDFVARCVAGLSFTPRDEDFSFDLASRRLHGDVIVGSARYSAVRGARTRELVADGRQNYMLTIHEADYEVEVRGGATLQVSRGDLVIVSEGLQQSFTMPETGLLAIVLDERRMADMAPAIRSRALHHVPAAVPGSSLLAGYARMLLACPHLDETAAGLASGHLHQLAALALDRRSDPVEAEASGMAGARLALVRDDIARNLTDPELDLAAVARRQRVTPRYIQRLFAGEGTSFSKEVRDARLDLAREQLKLRRDRTVSDVAFDCGFGDLSNFNKAFRHRFGATPRDIKAWAMRNETYQGEGSRKP